MKFGSTDENRAPTAAAISALTFQPFSEAIFAVLLVQRRHVHAALRDQIIVDHHDPVDRPHGRADQPDERAPRCPSQGANGYSASAISAAM